MVGAINRYILEHNLHFFGIGCVNDQLPILQRAAYQISALLLDGDNPVFLGSSVPGDGGGGARKRNFGCAALIIGCILIRYADRSVNLVSRDGIEGRSLCRLLGSAVLGAAAGEDDKQ